MVFLFYFVFPVVQICLDVFGQQNLLGGLNKVSLAEQSPAPFFASTSPRASQLVRFWRFWLADGVILFFQIWLKHQCLLPPKIFNPLVVHLTVRHTISVTFVSMVIQFYCSLSGSKFRTVCKDCQIGHLMYPQHVLLEMLESNLDPDIPVGFTAFAGVCSL